MSLMSRKYIKTAAIFWGICLVVLVPVYLLALKPQMTRMETLQRQYQEKEIEAERIRADALESTRQELQKKIESLKAEFDRFVVPSKDAIQTLASIEIDKMCKDNGLDAYIDPWNSGEVQAFNECKYVQGQFIKVTFSASFNDFAKFLNSLERYKSVIFVDNFSISRPQEKEAKGNVEMNLAVLVARQASQKSGRS
jgi:hypothetical protein